MATAMGGPSPQAIADANRAASGAVSTGNSSTALLTAGSTFTGSWEDVSTYASVIVAAKTDQDGTFTVQFSPDGVNADSTLTRYYRTAQIEAPHRFTVTRRYCRVTFENTSASDQTYLRLQTLYTEGTALNAPMDSALAQDFDALPTRPTNNNDEVALGRRQGATLWNKFGFNLDVDVASSPEVVASFGGTFVPMTTAATLSIVSTSAADQGGGTPGTGLQQVVITGVDANREAQVEVVALDGTTPVVTSSTWLGVNRISPFLCGSSKTNVGDITATETGGSTVQAEMPAGGTVTEQCIFFVQAGHTALFKWLRASVARFGGGTEPVVTIKGWVYSPVANADILVLQEDIDASIKTDLTLTPEECPFPIVGPAVFWLEATTTRDDTRVNARFSLVEHRSVST